MFGSRAAAPPVNKFTLQHLRRAPRPAAASRRRLRHVRRDGSQWRALPRPWLRLSPSPATLAHRHLNDVLVKHQTVTDANKVRQAQFEGAHCVRPARLGPQHTPHTAVRRTSLWRRCGRSLS